MTTTTDPGAIDPANISDIHDIIRGWEDTLEKLREDGFVLMNIAAVEALRARVADLMEQNTVIRRKNGALSKGMADANDHAEALEARVAELAGALEDLIKAVDAHNHYLRTGSRTAFEEGKYDRSPDRARTALAAMPEQAVERARAVEGVVKAARFIAEESNYLHPEGELCSALTKLDTLGKEEK